MIFVHLALESASPSIRRSAISALERLVETEPELINLSILAALSSHLSKPQVAPSKGVASNGEEAEPRANKEGRLPAIILACGSFSEECAQDVKERLLLEFVLVAHHPGSCEYTMHCHHTLPRPHNSPVGNLRPVWIELCQKARIDPNGLVSAHVDELLGKVLQAIDVYSKVRLRVLKRQGAILIVQ